MDRVSPKKIFEDFREKKKETSNIIASRSADKSGTNFYSVFLYHAGRTGGVAISTAFSTVFRCLFEHTGASNRNLAAGRVEVISPEAAGAHHFFIGSHAPFGFHANFQPQPFELIALARDPVSRITSVYTKQCMRNGALPNQDDFIKFLTETNQHNAMTCQLCGLDPGSIIESKQLELAISNLDSHFTFFCDTSSSHLILDYYFNVFNFPNLIQEIPNRTLPAYQIKTDGLLDLILEKNQFDQKLFEWVCNNSRTPVAGGFGEDLSPFSMIIYEYEKKSHSAIKWRIFPTDLVSDLLTNEPYLMNDISRLYHRCSNNFDDTDVNA